MEKINLTPVHDNETYEHVTVRLDNAVYNSCTFIHCLFLYSGGISVVNDCKMKDCRVQFLDIAERAVAMWTMFKNMQVDKSKAQSPLVN